MLLRGINVGRAKRIAMADLRALLADLGGTDVRTLLQSGNVVLSAPAGPAELEAAVEEGIAERFGMDVRCLVRTAEELRAVASANPFPDVEDGSRLMALFLSAVPDGALLAAHDPVAVDPGRVRAGDRVLYQWCPDGLMAAPAVGTYVEKHLGVAVTARNWNTVTKLVALLDA